jgi:hypothetical protein
MNTSSQSRFRKGAVFNTKNAAPSVARVFKAARLFRLVAMWRSFKVRSLAAQKSGALFGFCLLRGDGTKPSLADFFTRFWCANVVPMKISMAVAMMFFGGKTLKVFRSVIRFVPIYMVDLFVCIKRLQPTSGNNSVHQIVTSTKRKVAVFADSWCVRLELSENFSAARNCKKVVKESVMDSVYFNANHAVPLGG